MQTVELKYKAPLIEIRDAVTRELLACCPTFKEAARWLACLNYKYVEGTNGVWKMDRR